MGSQSFPCSLPHLTFLGKLLHAHPDTSTTVATSYSKNITIASTVDASTLGSFDCTTGNFLEFILGGLTYPHDSVKSSVVYVLVQVCSRSQPNSLALPLVRNMCRHVSSNLATAKSQELTINLLGKLICREISQQNVFHVLLTLQAW